MIRISIIFQYLFYHLFLWYTNNFRYLTIIFTWTGDAKIITLLYFYTSENAGLMFVAPKSEMSFNGRRPLCSNLLVPIVHFPSLFSQYIFELVVYFNKLIFFLGKAVVRCTSARLSILSTAFYWKFGSYVRDWANVILLHTWYSVQNDPKFCICKFLMVRKKDTRM